MTQKPQGGRPTTDDRLGQHGSTTVGTLILFTVLALGGVGTVGVLRDGIADKSRCAGDAIVNLGVAGGGCAEGAGDEAALLFPGLPPAGIELAGDRRFPESRQAQGGRAGRGEDKDRGEGDDRVELSPSVEVSREDITVSIGGTDITLGTGLSIGIGSGIGIDGPDISESETPDGRTETKIGVELSAGAIVELSRVFDITVVSPRPGVVVAPLPPNRPFVGDIPPRRGPGDGEGGRRPGRPGNNGFGTVDGSNGTVRNPEIARGGQENATPAPPDDDDSSSTNEDRDSRENGSGRTDDPNSGDRDDRDSSGADHDAPGDQPGDGPE